jgi:methyl-accepting chemotaxis protein
MSFDRISIKALISSVLILLGLGAIILSFIGGNLFHQAALESQSTTLSRIMGVTAKEVMHQLHAQTQDLGASAGKGRSFRKAVKTLKDNPESREIVLTALNDQFNQRFVTGGYLDLAKLRLYDTNFQLVAQSSNGVTSLPDHLPNTIHSRAKVRKGGDRYKPLAELWTADGKGYYSVLVPVGGLRLSGYMEVVVNPAFNLRRLATMMEAPLTISWLNDEVAFESENWDEQSETSVLPVDYTLKSEGGEPILKLAILENIEEFSDNFSTTQLTNILLFVILVGVGVSSSFWIMNRYLFRPLKQFADDMARCSEGDLTVSVKPQGLKDTVVLGTALATLVDALWVQVAGIGANSRQLKSSAEELSTITHQTNTGVQQQQSETEQLATAMHQMSATVDEVARNAETAAAATRKTSETANEGRRIVTQTMDAIDTLASDLKQASGVIEELRDNSNSIGSVVEVIRGIAEQTNLLALNAAIEAARAGEQGRGFAVVADEVRTLAGRTQQSTQEIQEIVEKLQTGVGRAVSVMEHSEKQAGTSVEQAAKAGESLDAITTAVEEANDLNTQIASAAVEQHAVTEEINRNVTSINDISQQTANGASQTASASETVAALATTLQTLVDKFKLPD